MPIPKACTPLLWLNGDLSQGGIRILLEIAHIWKKVKSGTTIEKGKCRKVGKIKWPRNSGNQIILRVGRYKGFTMVLKN